MKGKGMPEVDFRDPSLTERNREIRRLRESGMKYKDIAQKFGITWQRAQQIYQNELRAERVRARAKLFSKSIS